MSHLIIEQGKEVGKEISVPASGIKFGRSPANDLVLEDEVLMLFQGRFFFKSDGTLWITDFSVGEKSHIGGVPIDEQQLKVGDLVEVGSTAFRVISTRQGEGAAPAPLPVVKDEKIDLGFKPAAKTHRDSPAKSHEKHASPIFRILQVLVIVLILLLVVVGATEVMRSKKSSGNGVRMKGIFFNYEFVHGSGRNIFRYTVDLTPDGVVTLRADDVRSRQFSKSAQLSAEELATLKRRIENSDFFKVTSDHVGKTSNDQYDLCDIALGCDGQFNHVRVLNREIPADVRQLKNTLEDYAFDVLDVSQTLLKDDSELIELSKEAYRVAETFYRERATSYDNLAQCIKHLHESVNFLETIEPKPEPYGKATDLLAKAVVEQSERYKEYMFLVDKAMRISEWEVARRNLQICSQIISDRSDVRNEIISKKTLEVEDKLR